MAVLLPWTLMACGGEGGGGGEGREEGKLGHAELSRSGKVMTQQGVGDAVVCVDLHGRGVCEAGAPVMSKTHADGSYRITYRPQNDADAQAFRSAPLLAQIPTQSGGYTLSAPGHCTQINPLTTLVQRHMVRSGESLEITAQAVARQLGIPVQHIYDYQHQPKVQLSRLQTLTDSARTAAALTDYALYTGAPAPLIHSVGDVVDEAPRLTSLNFVNATNYEFHMYSTNSVANAKGQIVWEPTYGGLINGNPRTDEHAHLFYITRNGVHYNGREDYAVTRGKPARIEISAKNKFTEKLSARGMSALENTGAMFELDMTTADISNQRMADFVRRIQDYEKNPAYRLEHSLFMINPAILGNATFPEGSRFYIKLKTQITETPTKVIDPNNHVENSHQV